MANADRQSARRGRLPSFPGRAIAQHRQHACTQGREGGWSTKYRNQPNFPQAQVDFCSGRIYASLPMHYLLKYDAQKAATNCGPPLRQSDVGSVLPRRASVKTEDMTDYRNMRICRCPSQEYVLERQAGVAVVTSTLFSSP